MDRRFPRNAQPLEMRNEWKGIKWQVVMTLNARASITHVSVWAEFDSIGPCFEGHAHNDVGPFDRVVDIIDVLLVEAAISLAEAREGGQQLRLDDID